MVPGYFVDNREHVESYMKTLTECFAARGRVGGGYLPWQAVTSGSIEHDCLESLHDLLSLSTCTGPNPG